MVYAELSGITNCFGAISGIAAPSVHMQKPAAQQATEVADATASAGQGRRVQQS
jgi:hypothetical protein